MSRDLINDEAPRVSMVKSLDVLYQCLQSSQRTTEAKLGLIETQHRSILMIRHGHQNTLLLNGSKTTTSNKIDEVAETLLMVRGARAYHEPFYP